MPTGRQKSRTLRRIAVKTPSDNKIQYKKRKPCKAKCGECGSDLKGVSRERPLKTQNMTASKKKPTRPYGGNLCSRCMRKKMVEKARAEK